MDTPQDPFWAERYRHGPVTEEQIHQGYDAVLDAWIAAQAPHPPRWGMTRTAI